MKNTDPEPVSFPDTFGDSLLVYDFEDGTAQFDTEIVSGFENAAVVYTTNELIVLRNHISSIIDKKQGTTP